MSHHDPIPVWSIVLTAAWSSVVLSPKATVCPRLPKSLGLVAPVSIVRLKTTESNLVNLTQEFLSHMLGVQRTSVTTTAYALQKSGLIRYSRGKVEILDRKGIEDCACECYAVLRHEIEMA